MNSVKGLFKLHFVVVFSCLIVGSIFSVSEEITLVTSDGKEFVIEVTDTFFKASNTLQNMFSDFDMISELPKPDGMIESEEGTVVELCFSSEALELLIECTAFDQMKMNGFVLAQKRDRGLAEAVNLANYLELEQVAKYLIEATSAVVTKKDANRISINLDIDMRRELKMAREHIVLKGVLTTQEKRARRKQQKRQSIERRKERQAKLIEKMFFLLEEGGR